MIQNNIYQYHCENTNSPPRLRSYGEYATAGAVAEQRNFNRRKKERKCVIDGIKGLWPLHELPYAKYVYWVVDPMHCFSNIIKDCVKVLHPNPDQNFNRSQSDNVRKLCQELGIFPQLYNNHLQEENIEDIQQVDEDDDIDVDQDKKDFKEKKNQKKKKKEILQSQAYWFFDDNEVKIIEQEMLTKNVDSRMRDIFTTFGGKTSHDKVVWATTYARDVLTCQTLNKYRNKTLKLLKEKLNKKVNLLELDWNNLKKKNRDDALDVKYKINELRKQNSLMISNYYKHRDAVLSNILTIFDIIGHLIQYQFDRGDLLNVSNLVKFTLSQHEGLLPPSEGTYALHELIHVTDQIIDLGPPLMNAMFKYEQKNLILRKLMKNTSSPIASIVKNYCIAEASHFSMNLNYKRYETMEKLLSTNQNLSPTINTLKKLKYNTTTGFLTYDREEIDEIGNNLSTEPFDQDLLKFLLD